jgi:motility quorum-sensing regulator/GCU-specific mRNA interferase toxin
LSSWAAFIGTAYPEFFNRYPEGGKCVMDKYKPTYDLDAIKAGVDDPDKVEITTTAILGAAEIGFDRSMIVDTVKNIKKSQFYKSMTSYKNHRIWQDVYRVPSEAGLIYVKFVAGTISEFALVSFKEK